MSDIFRQGRASWSPLNIALVALTVAAFAFGGASRLHELRLALVELIALPALVLALALLIRSDENRPSRFAGLILIGLCAVPLIQLIPLPPGIWTGLAGREDLSTALNLAGLTPGWLPLSLNPDRTWQSALALIPPVAMFVGVLVCNWPMRARLIAFLLGFALLSTVLAAAQVVEGGDRLYLWPTTDIGNVVGFFANRNHLATLCLASMPFAAVIAGRSLRHRSETRVVLWISTLFFGLMVVALGVIRSRMGVLLLCPTLVASLLAAWSASGGGRPRPLLLGLAGGATVALGIVALYGLTPLLERFDTSRGREGRFENWPLVADAAQSYLPLGSGLGSFDQVFRSVEPLAQLDSTYFNQAHNDYLEIWLEAGWPGAILLIAFLVWFGRRTWAAWSSSTSPDQDLQRASTVAIGIVLLHSAVDYPLRTETVAVILALLCALLEAKPRANLEEARRSRRRRRRSPA